MILNHLPETARIRIGWYALKYDFCSTTGERPIGDVGVARYPANISGAPENILGLQIKGILHG